MEIILFTGLMILKKIIRRNKWNFLVNYQVTTHKILECFPVHQNIFPLILHNNVYKLSIIIIGLSEPKVAQKYKRDNIYSNINHISTMFKGTMILCTRV